MAARSFFDSLRLVALLGVMALLAFPQFASAAQYAVGASSGWAVGNDLQLWASQYEFHVGDDLYFPYPAGEHKVLLVTEEDYNSCNLDNPMTSDNAQGNMAFTLTNEQTYYFICGIPSHCSEGLKVTITVVATSTVPTTPGLAPPTTEYAPPITPYTTPYGNFHYYNNSASSKLLGAAMAAAAAILAFMIFL